MANTQAQKAAATGYGKPIYLTLNGNSWRENSVYLTVAIHEANKNGSPLYVTSNIGGPPDPPPCPPGFPNCGNP